ncbi:MAG: hypothetical protein KDA28_13040, partial [Phycisphaerales bacterium]|nr:hypothetical protein [Phycisphaerales bacterium]
DQVTATTGTDPVRIVLGTDAEPTSVLTRQEWRPDAPGWGTAGTWYASLAHPTTFEILVHFNGPVSSSEVELTSGGRRARVETVGPTTTVSLGVIELPAGRHDLHLTTLAEGKPVPPAQLVLRRID